MSDRREELAREIRAAFGIHNDPDLAVVQIVEKVVTELAACHDGAAGIAKNFSKALRAKAKAEAELAAVNDLIDKLEVYGTPEHPMGVTIAVMGHMRCNSAREAIDAAKEGK